MLPGDAPMRVGVRVDGELQALAAHDALGLQKAEVLQRGDVVGRVGNTGRSTGYHLHYEVRVDGDPVNPLAYILDDTTSSAP